MRRKLLSVCLTLVMLATLTLSQSHNVVASSSPQVELTHTHSETSGSCYTPVYHSHSSGCYSSVPCTCYKITSTSTSSWSCYNCHTTQPVTVKHWVYSCGASGSGDWMESKCTNCGKGSSGGTQPSGHTKSALTCTKSTSTIERYNLSCSETTCGTAYISCSLTADCSSAKLSVVINSQGAGATATGCSWSTGSTGSSIDVTQNGTYTCNLSWKDNKSEVVSTSILTCTVDGLDPYPPNISGVSQSPNRATYQVVGVSATDNVGVTEYKLNKK